MRAFEEGQTVQLRSGGPVMTVAGFDEDANAYACTWFEGPKLSSARFKEFQLQEAGGAVAPPDLVRRLEAVEKLLLSVDDTVRMVVRMMADVTAR